jgi:hypothetical protein
MRGLVLDVDEVVYCFDVRRAVSIACTRWRRLTFRFRLI